MKNYAALIIENGITNVVTVSAKNLSDAKVLAAEFGPIIFIGIDAIGTKTYK
jgi:hypothetical protein